MSIPTLSGWSTVCLIPFQAVNVRYTDTAHAIVDLSLLTTAWWTATKADLSDVRFTDAYGHVLNFYIPTFNRSAKTGSAMIVFPASVPENGYATIWAFSGNAAATNIADFTKVAARLPSPYDMDAELIRCRCADGDNTGIGGLNNQLYNDAPNQAHLTLHGTFNWTTRTQPGYAGTANGWAGLKCPTLAAGSGYIAADPGVGWNTSVPAFTVAMWVYPEAAMSALNFLWALGYGDNATFAHFAISDGGMVGQLNAGTGAEAVSATDFGAVPNGQWLCLGLTFGLDGLSLWRNGVKSTQSNRTPTGIESQFTWPSRGHVFGGDSRFSSTVTPNPTSMSFGPIIVSRSNWTPEEWDGFYRFYNPVQVRARRKMRFRGMPFMPSAMRDEGVLFQEGSILDTPNDPDGYRYTIPHSTGINGGFIRQLRKTNDLINGPYKNFGKITARPESDHAAGYFENGVQYEVVPNYTGGVRGTGANDVLIYASTNGGHTWSGSTQILSHTQINDMTAATLVNPQIMKPAGSPLGPYILGFSGGTLGGQWGEWFATAPALAGPYTMLNGGLVIDMTLGPGTSATSTNFRHELFYDAVAGFFYALYGLAANGQTPACLGLAKSADLVTWTACNAESKIGLEMGHPLAYDQLGDPVPKEIIDPVSGQTHCIILTELLSNSFKVPDGFRSYPGIFEYRGTFKQFAFDGSFTQLASPASPDSAPYDTASGSGNTGYSRK